MNHLELNIVNEDIMKYNKEKVYKDSNLKINTHIDLIIGGSPCQSFSTARKRQAFEDVRGKAMIKYAEIIEDIKPKMFLLENVKGLLSAALKHRKIEDRSKENPLEHEEQRGSALEYLLKKFKSYNVSINLVNLANYGVAQKRERVFIIGVRKDIHKHFEFPKPTHTKEKWVTLQK